jgi:secreted trypsin-like serine protease
MLRALLPRGPGRGALRLLILAASASAWITPARTMVGGAATADAMLARHVVMLLSSRGTFCSGVVVGRGVVLSAAHCVHPGADYKLAEFDAARQPVLKDVATVARHPGFDGAAALRQRVTADVALLKLAQPLDAKYAAIALADTSRPIAVGDRLLVAGFGLAVPGDGRSGGTLRAARLAVTGQPGSLQVRLVDPSTKGDRPGLGACTGDSGAPVFTEAGGQVALLGVVSWSTGPALAEGCGGLTGTTPLGRYRDWIVGTIGKLDSSSR